MDKVVVPEIREYVLKESGFGLVFTAEVGQPRVELIIGTDNY